MDGSVRQNLIGYILVTSPGWGYLVALLVAQIIVVVRDHKPKDGE